MFLRKRVILYFLLLGFPMGLGAGAVSWLEIPEIPLLRSFPLLTPSEEGLPEELPEDEPYLFASAFDQQESSWTLDFSQMHPLTVAAFSLLFCTGVLLAAEPHDESQEKKAEPADKQN